MDRVDPPNRTRSRSGGQRKYCGVLERSSGSASKQGRESGPTRPNLKRSKGRTQKEGARKRVQRQALKTQLLRAIRVLRKILDAGTKLHG